ncbi:MAG TPA: hypothetical protein DD435_03560 [Cyanobacteria bacterium UBA8530]|nr:hypothetical protein [Cyanobacteria bacterium UBA8530]
MRRVSLLGAFEISAEVDAPVRDGLILGSRREQMGFVLDTSRDNIEQIVSAAGPPALGAPLRLAVTLGTVLMELGCSLLRIELKPIGPTDEEEDESYVQGFLVFRQEKKVKRLKMTATESIQVALAEDIPMLASLDLLQLDVSQFLDEIDEFSDRYVQETNEFKSFVDSVKASDFEKYLKNHPSDDADKKEKKESKDSKGSQEKKEKKEENDKREPENLNEKNGKKDLEDGPKNKDEQEPSD